MVTMSQSKFDNINAVATQSGIIAAAAMDQRGSLLKSIAKEKGVDVKDVTDAMMEEFKTAVSKVLSPYASAMLLDPVWGLPAAKARQKGCGLLLAYEESGYDNTKPGRLPDLLTTYSVRRLKQAGANCCKILLYYTPFDPPAINEQKHAWVERIGAECAAEGLPFFLECVGYAHDGMTNQPHSGVEGGTHQALHGGGATRTPVIDEKGLAFAKIKPDVVRGSMAEFNKPQYRVDVMKVEVPVNMQFVGSAYSKQEAMEHFRAAAKATDKPFIYLSAGVSDAEFRASLELAIEAGVSFNGVLCGRATWKEGIPVYAKEGVKALEAWLADRGVKNIQALNAVLERGAKPWWNAYGGRDKIQCLSAGKLVKNSDPVFCIDRCV